MQSVNCTEAKEEIAFTLKMFQEKKKVIKKPHIPHELNYKNFFS